MRNGKYSVSKSKQTAPRKGNQGRRRGNRQPCGESLVITRRSCREAHRGGIVLGCPHAGTKQLPALASKKHLPEVRVIDGANILTPAAERRMDQRLRNLEKKRKHQLVVVTVTSLHGKSIENFARDYGSYISVGRKDHNDGAVIVVAPNERKARIELGKGLRGYPANSRAAQIMDAIMLPAFAKGAFDAGIEGGTNAIIQEMMHVPQDTRPASIAVQTASLVRLKPYPWRASYFLRPLPRRAACSSLMT